MLRIRFHGRGGHGIKTASRIVGTAAFAAGFEVQDAPLYGAERRGAAIVAFTRIASQAILERGVITDPDLIVIADETLLEDPAAGLLRGQQTATAVFLNAAHCGDLAERHRIKPPLLHFDLTETTRAALASGSALSAALAAATCRLIGIISPSQLMQAARQELAATHLADEAVAKNLQLAGDVFGRLEPLAETQVPNFRTDPTFRSALAWEPVAESPVCSLAFDPPYRSAPTILAAGNADQRATGNWRVERPEIDYERCTRCGICYVRCPDGAIELDPDGYPVIDYDHCKGCLICWDECPVADAVHRQREVKAW